MKLLFLAQENKLSEIDEIVQQLRPLIGTLDFRALSVEQGKDLKSYIIHQVDLSRYDRILFSFSLETLQKQSKYLQMLKNLHFMHTTAIDPNGEDMAVAKQWVKFYRKMPWVRIFVKNLNLAKYLQTQGLDAWGIGVGYDNNLFDDYHCRRNIDLACLYPSNIILDDESEQLLSILRLKYIDLLVEKQSSNSHHIKRLNECKIVILPFTEKVGYSVSAFQTMASGCVLALYNLGEKENRFYGLVDMENIVLFKNIKELDTKIKLLSEDSNLFNKIAEAGTHHARQHLSLHHVAVRISRLLDKPLRRLEDYQLGLSIFGLKL